MIEDPLQTFATELASEIEEIVTGAEAPTLFSGEMFTKLVMERLEEAERIEEAFDLYQEGHTGRASYRIDGYAIDEDREVLELFTTIHTGEIPPVRLPMAELRSAYERALRFARASMDGLADKLEPSNTDASDLARRIEREASRISTIRLTLLTDQLTGPSLPEHEAWAGRVVEHDAFDIARLHRILGEGETRSDIAVDLRQLAGRGLPCLPVRPDAGGYEAYLTVLPGEILSSIYQSYGVRLLELNVRAFLGIQGRKSVNAELRKTISDQPSMFLAFNNGLVATVDDILFDNDEHGRSLIVGLKGLQIVNGGQTTASLHRARFKDRLSLQGVEVPVKIIKVTNGDLAEMVTSVSRAANRQNTVQQADFSSNDPFHQRVEELANNSWLENGKGRWFYERARGSYLAAEQKASYRARDDQAFRTQTPRTRRLSKLDLARYLNVWGDLPFRVCLGGQKNFQHFMQRLKDRPPPPPDESWFRRLIGIGIIYRAAERIVRQMGFPAFRSQIVAYLIASLSQQTGGRIDFEELWRRQAISSELEDLLRSWAPHVNDVLRSTAGQRNPGEWFKREECWEAFKLDLPQLLDPMPPELARSSTAASSAISASASGKSQKLSAEDFDRIHRCMEVDSATLLQAGELGQRERVLHWKTAGILRTLASYAAGGWEKKPSVKQARFALEALQAVRDAGLLQAERHEAKDKEER
ncbi:AIPR family protein (plasmid) [Rhizobium sp. B230/85]|uniref:AIPR family protein n=1 Tax=unclassified Rhizobium TaxID=2613769 RepID=UPI001ADB98A3|nr:MULTISPECIES: AIPR family protein [unclassified Rhizobium]MBO9136207.1 AIPR family protein [Rhizobium sp. B209b/85]QXZ99897.1 AIPR family protein [Rhizobium sp. B230/85]